MDREDISSSELTRMELWQWIIMHAEWWDTWVSKVAKFVSEIQWDAWVVLVCGSILLGFVMAISW